MNEINTLQDAINLIESFKGDFTKISQAEEFWKFANRIDMATVSIMKGRSDEYVIGMLSLVQALSATILILQGRDPVKCLELVDSELIGDYSALIMKLVIGLSAMEELR